MTYQQTKDLFEDFNSIKKMNTSEKIKARLFGELLASVDNPWRVVGITKEAMCIFKKNGFKKVSRMGINRCHFEDRNIQYKEMLKKDYQNANDFWKDYYDKDKTIFGTASENKKGIKNNPNFKYFNSYKEEELKNGITLFICRGYAWKHNKEEINFLNDFYEKHKTYFSCKD